MATNEELQEQINVLRRWIKTLVMLVSDDELARADMPRHLTSDERARILTNLSAECIDGPIRGAKS